MSYVPAYGAGLVAHFHAPDAVLVEYDLSEHAAMLDAAVASLRGAGVAWTLRPTFQSPFVPGTTAQMHRNMLLMAPGPLLAAREIGYDFSGLHVPAQACTPEVQAVMDIVNRQFAHGDAPFDRVLVNEYESTADTISQHSDKGTVGDIVGIAVGARRVFRLSHAVGGRSKTLTDVVSEPYRALVMEGAGFQRQLKHGVPKLKAFENGQRWSFTFRRHVEKRGEKRPRD